MEWRSRFSQGFRCGWPYGTLVLAAGLATAPFLRDGFWPFNYDARCHARWFQEFSNQFWAGEPYPRWLAEMNEGLGSPTFFFYPPLTYWLSGILRPFFPHDLSGGSALGLGAALGLALSGLFMFRWLRTLYSPRPALVASLAYMLAPYHLATDLYGRGALAEFWAFVWLPAILLFVDRLLAGERRAICGLAASYAALVLTHLPTTLTFSPVPLAYAWFMAGPGRRLACFGFVVGGMALGAGLAALYLVPALALREHVSMQALVSGNLYYAHSFFFREFNFRTFSLGDAFKTRMFWQGLTMYGAALGALALAWPKVEAAGKRRLVFWLGVCAFTAFMTVPLSQPVWQWLPVLQTIQFPWRFHVGLSVAVAVMVALALQPLSRPLGHRSLFLLQLLYMAVVAWVFFAIQAAWPLWQSDAPRLGQAVGMSWDVPEYRPRWARGDLNVSLGQMSEAGGALAPLKVIRGNGSFLVQSHQPRRILFTVRATQPVTLLAGQLYFPGWTARSGSAFWPVGPSPNGGLVKIEVGPGNHTIHLELKPTLAERIGLWLSLVALGALALAYLVVARSPKPKAGHTISQPHGLINAR